MNSNRYIDDITVICPRNDLESNTIVSIATGIGLDIRVSSQAWGGTLGKEPEANITNLKRTVVVVELPDYGFEEMLRSRGHEVTVIDHHNYGNIYRWKPKSSLEQFCELVGSPMTDDLYAVAANDRDFIAGLARLGLSYERMKEIRSRERAVRGTQQLINEAFQNVKKPLRSLEDLDLFLVPEKYESVMGEVAQWPNKEDYDKGLNEGMLHLRNCLILYHETNNTDRITRVEFFGGSSYKQDFEKLSENHSFTDFHMWAGGGEYNYFFGAKPKYLEANQKIFDDLIDHILSFTLISGRPLRHFSTTFLFPFRFKEDPHPKITAKPVSQDGYGSQELLFFLPQVRSMFYRATPSEDDPFLKWTLPVYEGDILSVYEKTNSVPINVPIKEISLYKFFNDIYILSLSVARDTNKRFWEDQPLWKALASSQFDIQCTTPMPTRALLFNNLARIVYASYPEQERECKIADRIIWHYNNDQKESKARFREEVEQDISDIIEAMIAKFVGPGKEIDKGFLHDDRMFVHTCFAFSGSGPQYTKAEDTYHALFTRATYVDKPGSDYIGGYAYDREFIKKLSEPFTYRRWYEENGDLFGFSRFSAVYFGFGEFFHNPISGHVNTMYLRMSIIALFYRASLLYYGYKVSAIEQPGSPRDSDTGISKYRDELLNIHWELTKFTNRYWFDELSSQDQPIELFDMQAEAMELKQQYNRVKADIDRAYGVMESKASYRLGRLSFYFAIVGLVVSIIFLANSAINQTSHLIIVMDWVIIGLGSIGVFIIVLARFTRITKKLRPLINKLSKWLKLDSDEKSIFKWGE